MTAINVVRFRVKPGMDQAFLDAHRDGKAAWPGMLRSVIINAGERTYVLIAEWSDMNAIRDARTRMIATLDTFRHALEDMGPGLGVTDAVSGEIVLAIK